MGKDKESERVRTPGKVLAEWEAEPGDGVAWTSAPGPDDACPIEITRAELRAWDRWLAAWAHRPEELPPARRMVLIEYLERGRRTFALGFHDPAERLIEGETDPWTGCREDTASGEFYAPPGWWFDGPEYAGCDCSEYAIADELVRAWWDLPERAR